MSEDRADGEMAEAAAHPFFEPQTSEQRLEENKTRERRQLAVLQSAVRAGHGSCSGLRLCYTSWEAVSFGYGFIFGNTLYYECRPLLRFSDHEISLFIPSLHITGGDVQRNTTNSLLPCLLCHLLTIRVDIYATGGHTLEEIQEQFDHISLPTFERALEEAATIINTASAKNDKQVL